MANKDEIAIKVSNLKKTFRIPLEKSSGIKQKVINILKGKKGYREFTPLNDISFEIKKGEFFGIVGRNGSGKSTLLKSIAGIYTPTSGGVHVNGKLVPFIELGVGFNAELTGRENVYLNGAMLGFSNQEVDAMYDEIVDFAELHDFMEESLKNYSSGMQVRLAFSIAIRAKGDVLLLDEVLAVGDEAFQRKCYNYFDDLRRNKKSVILVTHDMRAVERYCNRAMFIEDGAIVSVGAPHKIAALYSRANEAPDEVVNDKLDEIVSAYKAVSVTLSDVSGNEKGKFDFNETAVVTVEWESSEVHNVGVAILRRDGEYIFGTNTYQDGIKINKSARSIAYSFRANLSAGDYFVKVGFFGASDAQKIDFIEQGPVFVVNKDYDDGGWGGITKLDHKWGA